MMVFIFAIAVSINGKAASFFGGKLHFRQKMKIQTVVLEDLRDIRFCFGYTGNRDKKSKQEEITHGNDKGNQTHSNARDH